MIAFNRFLHNYSLTWGRCRYEIRVWRHWPFRIEFIRYKGQDP